MTETAERVCPDCGKPISDDDGTTVCARTGETMLTACHGESDCRHPDCGR